MRAADPTHVFFGKAKLTRKHLDGQAIPGEGSDQSLHRRQGPGASRLDAGKWETMGAAEGAGLAEIQLGVAIIIMIFGFEDKT